MKVIQCNIRKRILRRLVGLTIVAGLMLLVGNTFFTMAQPIDRDYDACFDLVHIIRLLLNKDMENHPIDLDEVIDLACSKAGQENTSALKDYLLSNYIFDCDISKYCEYSRDVAFYREVIRDDKAPAEYLCMTYDSVSYFATDEPDVMPWKFNANSNCSEPHHRWIFRPDATSKGDRTGGLETED